MAYISKREIFLGNYQKRRWLYYNLLKPLNSNKKYGKVLEYILGYLN